MAATRAGDRVEDLMQTAHEVHVSGMQAHFRLLTQAYCDFKSPKVDQSYLDKITQASQMLSDRGDTIFGKAYNALRFVDSGVRPVDIPKPKIDAAKLIKSAIVTGQVNGYKKAMASPYYFLSPEGAKETVNFAAQTLAQGIMGPIKENQVKRVSAEQRAKMGPIDTDQYGKIVQDERKTRLFAARIPESGACKFCLMLASRGSVYSDATVRFRSHNNCRCTPSFSSEVYVFSDKHQAQIEKWMDDNRAEDRRMRLMNNEEMVRQGYRKRITKTTQVDRPNGEGKQQITRTSYVKTQKAKQLEQAIANSRNESYKAAMNKTPKPAHAATLTSEQVATEIKTLEQDLTLNMPTGKPVNAITTMDEYRMWARKLGILDESMITTAAQKSETLQKEYTLARAKYAADKLEHLTDVMSLRIRQLNATNNPTGELQNYEWWKKFYKNRDEHTLKVALDKANVILKK